MTAEKVLIIDSQPLYARALSSLVQEVIDPLEVTVTTNTKQILDSVREENVELIIMDVSIEGRDGISLAKSIFANGYAEKLLFVSSNDYESLSNVAYTIGAHGYLTKYENQSTLGNAIINVLKGYTMFKGQPAQSDQQALSEREVTVLSYLMQGYSNQKISELLMLSNKTISTYKARILKKYNAKSIVEIAEVLRS
ncbi:response regulator transcription factor [Vibrio vulnificus]|uniref:response regulator transcription factor n=1 Tax=Vibrio vulnificus TaxID=672 RepID=UPI00159355E9|nr:response regulator transcription factor [Vibrio vulnificus]EJE8556872.1 response regulator transcription factor [Vibrio vulnificus]EJE8559066.1 response regulator transcription factor [Vibrio vulnificus]MCA3951037.1 response regulator transcription factor [Vibrio vulnificus]NVD21688.1 response regulator transcription factor [Vibrio vulnificus]